MTSIKPHKRGKYLHIKLTKHSSSTGDIPLKTPGIVIASRRTDPEKLPYQAEDFLVKFPGYTVRSTCSSNVSVLGRANYEGTI